MMLAPGNTLTVNNVCIIVKDDFKRKQLLL